MKDLLGESYTSVWKFPVVCIHQTLDSHSVCNFMVVYHSNYGKKIGYFRVRLFCQLIQYRCIVFTSEILIERTWNFV